MREQTFLPITHPNKHLLGCDIYMTKNKTVYYKGPKKNIKNLVQFDKAKKNNWKILWISKVLYLTIYCRFTIRK